MTTSTTSVPSTVTFEEVLNLILSAPERGALRLVGSNDAEAFYRRSASDGWVQLRQYTSGERPVGLNAFITTHSAADLFFAPVLLAAPASASALLPLSSVWGGIQLPLRSSQLGEPRPSVDPESERAARERLSKAVPTPSLVINEGDRLVALWKLSTPIADLARARSLLRKLTNRIGGDRELSDPATALVAIPGTRTTAIHPSRIVTVETWQPDRHYALDTIETWLGGVQ